MHTGIIGAGKVGCSLGKYFVLHGLSLSGFSDADNNAARTAADFAGTDSLEKLEDLIRPVYPQFPGIARRRESKKRRRRGARKWVYLNSGEHRPGPCGKLSVR